MGHSEAYFDDMAIESRGCDTVCVAFSEEVGHPDQKIVLAMLNNAEKYWLECGLDVGGAQALIAMLQRHIDQMGAGGA